MQTQDVPLGYFAHPESGPSPSLVLIHDVWGLTPHARDYACRFAREGFGVLALDAAGVGEPGAERDLAHLEVAAAEPPSIHADPLVG